MNNIAIINSSQKGSPAIIGNKIPLPATVPEWIPLIRAKQAALDAYNATPNYNGEVSASICSELVDLEQAMMECSSRHIQDLAVKAGFASKRLHETEEWGEIIAQEIIRLAGEV